MTTARVMLDASLTEKQWTQQVTALAKQLGWLVYHTWLSKFSEAGFPDLVLVCPRRRRALFIELKTEKAASKVSPKQQVWLDALTAVAEASGGSVECHVLRPRDFDRAVEMLR